MSSDATKPAPSCSNCSAIWQKQGTTNCWSDPAARPGKPAYCPSDPHAELISAAFGEYTGDAADARLARMAAKVEGLCYQPISRASATRSSTLVQRALTASEPGTGW